MLAVPLGNRADGRRLVVPLSQWHVLIGGLSGAGKSSTLRVLLIGAAQSPDVALVLIDPKRIELTAWRPRASTVATEPGEIARTLRELVELMDDRYRVLEHQAAGAAVGRLVLVVVDELAAVVASGESKRDRENATRIRLLLERGRAAGMIVVAATQRPAADVIPTSLRDLFTFRICHATSTREMTEMVLADAWRDGPAHELPVGADAAGLAWCLMDGDRVPNLARIWWADESLAARVAVETTQLRPVCDQLVAL